jgi:hypothetical protein
VLFAVPNWDPLEEALYQSITAPDEEAFSTTVPVPHREAAVPDGLAGTVYTVAATAVREVDRQPPDEPRAWA